MKEQKSLKVESAIFALVSALAYEAIFFAQIFLFEFRPILAALIATFLLSTFIGLWGYFKEKTGLRLACASFGLLFIFGGGLVFLVQMYVPDGVVNILLTMFFSIPASFLFYKYVYEPIHQEWQKNFHKES